MIMQLDPSPSPSTMFDFDSFTSQSIPLDPNHIQQAIRWSNQVQDNAEQWPAYLSFLALLGFQQWVNETALNLKVDDRQCSLLLTHQSQIITNLQVGAFKVCLLPVGNWFDSDIYLPQATIEHPQYRAHFYVLIEVQEEWSQVNIAGFLRHDLLKPLLGATSHQNQEEDYRIPLTQFETDPNQLLLFLECLDPDTIPLPNSASSIARTSSITAISLKSLLQPIVNVSLWLRDEIDAISQHLNWILLPAMSPAMRSQLLSPVDELESVITEVEHLMGTQLRPQARGAYQDIQLADNALRLYAMTWTMVSPEGGTEWVLLLVLGAQPGHSLRVGTSLQVRAANSILVEQILEHPLNPAYLFAKIVGTLDEQFTVTLSRSGQNSVTLPPFAFQPESTP